MATFKLLLLPGDGIGPEVMAEVEKIIDFFQREGAAKFEIEKGLVGGSAYDAHGKAISESDMDLAQAASKDPQKFMRDLDDSSWIGIASMQSGTYDELVSSGRLSLIRDERLRTAIANNLNDYRSTASIESQPMTMPEDSPEATVVALAPASTPVSSAVDSAE